jgi:restriction system protein
MARRGFFAELHHQSMVAARERARAAREGDRAFVAAVRRAEVARRAEEQAIARQSRAEAAEKKRLDAEAREAHVEAMEAEAERLNGELARRNQDLESLLAATLDVDDYVDLNRLRETVAHPPFDRTDLEVPVPAPPSITDPPKPVLATPPPPTGLRALFGKKKHAKAVAEAAAAHERAVAEWQAAVRKGDHDRRAAAERRASQESQRAKVLATERARYAAECAAREEKAAARNRELDTLIANLGYGAVDAINEYVAIVLSNSVYPAHFPVAHSFDFELATAELRLRVMVPGPESMPTIKSYKYTRASDSLATTSLSQKVCKEQYGSAVHQVALRSLHEVFEADRRGLIKAISLDLGTETTDPATGLRTYVPLVAVGTERESFLKLNLANVQPEATLAHLGAAVSKNPFGLVPAVATGIRRS